MIKMKWFKHYACVFGMGVYDYPGLCTIEFFLGKRTWQITLGGTRG